MKIQMTPVLLFLMKKGINFWHILNLLLMPPTCNNYYKCGFKIIYFNHLFGMILKIILFLMSLTLFNILIHKKYYNRWTLMHGLMDILLLLNKMYYIRFFIHHWYMTLFNWLNNLLNIKVVESPHVTLYKINLQEWADLLNWKPNL